MTTRFSKKKLVKAQEKKAKGGFVSGLLSKKKTGDASKKDSVVIPPPAYSLAKRPASPTSSLEMIASGGDEVRKKKKVGGRSFIPTFWDDVDATALKACEALSMEDLNPLMAKSSNEVMSSHIQKLVQVCVVGCFYFFFSFSLLLLSKIFHRLWGSLCSSLENSWTWRRRPRLSL